MAPTTRTPNPRVELVWSHPDAARDGARRVLLRTLPGLGLPATWEEWRPRDPLASDPIRRTKEGASLFVNGQRVWHSREPLPEPAALGALITAAAQRPAPKPRDPLARRLRLSLLPALGLALLPKCPLCWAAYAGVASSWGLGGLPDQRAVLFALLASLGIALGAVAWRARDLRDRRPLALAALGTLLLLLGRLATSNAAVTWAGLTTLALAALWSAWPQRPTRLLSTS